MTEVPTTTLGSLMLQQPIGSVAVIEGHEAVILSGADDGEVIEAYHDGAIRPYKPDTQAAAFADQARQVAVLREALLLVDQLRRQGAEKLERQTAEYHDALNRIRDYAIEKYHESAFCLEGLNEFLRAFELREYEPDTD